MKVVCWNCEHYNQRFYLYTTGKRNVSGGLAWYQGWSKHRCALKQEDRYPNNCDYERLERPKEVEKTKQQQKPMPPSRHKKGCGWLTNRCTCGHFKEDDCSWAGFISEFGFWRALRIFLRKIKHYKEKRDARWGY